MIEFDNYIDTFFVMLGFGCNFKCRYCLQHNFKEILVKKHPSKEFYTIIDNEARKKFNDTGSRVIVHFFGGEPLVYKDIMYEIIDTFESMKSPVIFSMITNGSLIDEDMIQYIDKHNIMISISWDGRNSIKTRLRDVFKENKNNIFKLKNFNISGVMSALNYPKEFLEDVYNLNNEYNKISNTWFSWNLDPLYDLDNPDKELYDLDFDKIYYQVDEMTKNYLYDKDKNLPTQNMYVEEIIGRIKNYSEPDVSSMYSCCGNGVNVINIDLDGNLFLCHNDTNMKLGDINSDINSYKENYKLYNKVPTYFKNKCANCNVRFACYGGCMLVSENERDKFYCRLQESLYLPIIENLLKLND